MYKTVEESPRVYRVRLGKDRREFLEQENHFIEDEEDMSENNKRLSTKFIESMEIENDEEKKKKRKSSITNRLKYRKTFDGLIEEEKNDVNKNKINYFTIKSKAPKVVDEKFCAVCGFHSLYVCTRCGSHYCSVDCYGVHKETRCIKWT
ncbi:hypothetical protein SNEBB_005396 [Seison nebaliae]|nr:hypothetical protein SNEBB_005396 [Seison nebaliae]